MHKSFSCISFKKRKKNLQSPTTPSKSHGAIRATHPHHEFLFLQVEEMTKEDQEMDGDPFGFPIQEIDANVQMNIPPSVLPNFKGMRSEDPEDFLFEVETICRSYGYSLHIQKLNFFPTTLKDKVLRWFMTLGTNSIRTCDDMKIVFLEKYKNNYKHHDLRNEVFNMNKKEDENLEDLVERFTYNIKRSKMHNLGSDILNTLLLNAIKDEWIDLLNLVEKGDVYQL